MPRKKLIRRCEPRYGVSRTMLETEAEYVAREMEDYLLLGIKELNEKLTKLRQLWSQADRVLECAIDRLPEREQVAVQCLIVRDMFHLIELYCTHLGTSSNGAVDTVPMPPPKEQPQLPPQRVKEKVLPAAEWLFGPGA